MTLIACPECGDPMTPATLAAHIEWAGCDELAAKRGQSRRLHPSSHRPTPDTDGAA